MISNYLNPVKVYKSLVQNIDDLLKYSKYCKIIEELNDSKKLESVGLSIDSKYNLYIGIDLNPELLLYSDISQESVELKLISEKIKKYTDFLTKEGILDYIKLEYDRVKTDDYYGYILQITYDFKQYNLRKLIYSASYFLSIVIALTITAITML